MSTSPFGSGGGSDPGPIGADGPFRDVTQGGAPGGRWPSDAELPIRAVSGGSGATTNGYSADATQPALPPPGSDQGSGLPPSGGRR